MDAPVLATPVSAPSLASLPPTNGFHSDHKNGIYSQQNGIEPVVTPTEPTPSATFAPDSQLPESNVRDDSSSLKHVSNLPEPPDSQPISEDISMVDAEPVPSSPPLSTDLGAPNGSIENGHINGDMKMDEDPHPNSPPALAPVAASPPLAADTADMPRPLQDDDEDGPPPAKRARVHSDADQASLAHSASPPPPSADGTPVPQSAIPASQPLLSSPTAESAAILPMEQSPTSPLGPTLASPGIGPNQHRFCLSVIRSLKKNKDAIPFLRPVDPVALGIPLYFQVIKTPMDLSTVERKLSSSNAAKPDPNPDNPHYIHVDEFAKDVRVIFTNCYTFNGLEHAVSQMAKRLEETFDRQMKQLPPPDIPKPVIPKAPSVKKQISPPVPKKPQVRRPSTSMPTIRRNDDSRPKREIHPPPPKDLPYTEGPKKMVPRKPKRLASKDDGTLEQLRFCSKVLSDLHRKQVWQAASPFYDPVDPVKLNIPDYFKFVKKPMDLSTMRKKLDDHQYPNAKKFEDDFRLMIKNCFIFNPPGTPVNIAGHELERIFNEKWAGLPVLHDGMSEDYEDEDDFDDDDETTKQQREIARLERELAKAKSSFMTTQMSSQPKPKKEKKKVPKPLQASSSKPSLPKTPKPAAPAPIIKKKKQKPTDEDVLSFEQKKDLSEAITNLNEDKLGRVIQIIHDGVPEIRDSTEEIELEIDHLPAAVLTKLYNFVVRPLRAPTQKRTRGGKGTGTGGLKRKSMDEDVEAEKIRQLEQRMALFEQGGNAGLAAALADAGVSDHSSDSSDDSDSSASDSE